MADEIVTATIQFSESGKCFYITGLHRPVCNEIKEYIGMENGMPLEIRVLPETTDTGCCLRTRNCWAIIKVISVICPMQPGTWLRKQTREFNLTRTSDDTHSVSSTGARSSGWHHTADTNLAVMGPACHWKGPSCIAQRVERSHYHRQSSMSICSDTHPAELHVSRKTLSMRWCTSDMRFGLSQCHCSGRPLFSNVTFK
jgi:hypothetical protein